MKRRPVKSIHLLRIARFDLNVKSNKTWALYSGFAEYANRLMQKKLVQLKLLQKVFR